MVRGNPQFFSAVGLQIDKMLRRRMNRNLLYLALNHLPRRWVKGGNKKLLLRSHYFSSNAIFISGCAPTYKLSEAEVPFSMDKNLLIWVEAVATLGCMEVGMSIAHTRPRETHYPAKYRRRGVRRQAKHQVPQQVLPGGGVVVGLQPIELLKELIHKVRNSEKVFCAALWQDYVLRKQLNYLLLALQGVALIIAGIAKLPHLLNTYPYLPGSNVGNRNVGGVEAHCTIFEHINLIAGAQYALLQRLRHLVAGGHAYNPLQVVAGASNPLLCPGEQLFKVNLTLIVVIQPPVTFWAGFMLIFGHKSAGCTNPAKPRLAPAALAARKNPNFTAAFALTVSHIHTYPASLRRLLDIAGLAPVPPYGK